MSIRRLYSSSFTVVRHFDATSTDSNYLKCILRTLTFKNLLITFLLTFLLVSFGFSPGSLRTDVWHIYIKNINKSISVVKIPSKRKIIYLTSETIIKLGSNTNRESNKMNAFEKETNAIKNSIKNAFQSVNKRIDYCPLYVNSKIKGSLDVNEILEKTGLTGLIQFHEKNIYNVKSNSYKENNLTYLDPKTYEANKNNEKFMAFWEIWHSNDLMLANATIPNANVFLGGYWRPTECISRYKVAIIIPYRDRLPHLMVLVRYLHIFLQRQLIDYRIFVAEPTTPLKIKFNKGRVMNSAFIEALKLDPTYSCVIFHDVDLIPEDDRNMYTCSQRPKHLSVGIDKFDYRLPYDYLVGGVFSIKPDQYRLTNGYSNSYWGWGGEDDDFSTRLKSAKLIINRPPTKIARYKMMRHKLQKLNEERHKLLKKTIVRQKNDGVNSVTYKVVETKLFTGFTYFLVDIGNP